MRRAMIPLAALPALPAVAETEGAADAWHVLDRITFDEVATEDSYAVHKTFPAEIADGAPAFEVSGYAVPMDLEGREFMLVSDLAECPFCGAGDHGVTVNVSMAEPMPGIDASQRVVLRGALIPVHDPETWQSVILTDAVRLDA
ncbi:hypothetical protein BCF33_0656 [Hasllibacter halocynthiae]|uniref:DUF3299 domain-containing protein n=1 Tax=Hasllibacter halocynthiae TaxID=595589 RepID=A0A2T0X849_9RHOB|nr:hypothetical protein [Hasllibacter halocynthiae]PRY95044.1 hypothetical protein BCF33_0656 [Hasllibacter halocynthiae]